MIPSLVAADLKRAVTEYLTTTFAIGDDETREELDRFLGGDPTGGTPGIFRGPYVRLRAPFKAVEANWEPPLEWLPDGFRPYMHQARAYGRLASLDQEPQPTLVTTGTGSGKTECFLHPILDHCARHRGKPGIKAIILYPMNALASDQAGRIAETIHDDPRLNGITAGLYLGGDSDGSFTGQGSMGPDSVITDRHALRKLPPDILLTNYRMLDFLLLRGEDRQLWQGTGPDSLRYLVLDEFHTYDGAQGTDVAMLVRRLGIRLGLARDGIPLGDVAPVATSATLGGGVKGAAMREFAAKVFGAEFEPDSLIAEERQTATECLRPIDYQAPIPDIADLPEPAVPGDLDQLAAAFIGRLPESREDLGEALLAHPLTWTVFEELSEKPRPIEEALERIVRQTREWAPDFREDQAVVASAVARYLALLSLGRRSGGRPLLTIEAQLWVREVSRLLRAIDSTPAFRWANDPEPAEPDLAEEPEPAEDLEPGDEPEPTPTPQEFAYAPAVYCRSCGRTGWMGRTSQIDGRLSFKAAEIYAQAPVNDPRLRTLILASTDEQDARFLDPLGGELETEPGGKRLPVLVTPDETAAKRNRCPSCNSDDDIVFVGSRIASLASVTISQLFGSEFAGVPKLLAFADSVQDASHRAAFFNARTYRFNLRTRLGEAVAAAGSDGVTLAGLGSGLVEAATAAGSSDEARRLLYDLVPVDLADRPALRTLWEKGLTPDSQALATLASRLELEAQLELGLTSRVGRTLELSGASAAHVTLPEEDQLADLVIEIASENLTGETGFDRHQARLFLHGLLERLRLRGAIRHRWLRRYIETGGKRWQIWGGRPDGMPAFPTGRQAPAFLWEGRSNGFDGIKSDSTARTWTEDWAARSLGLDRNGARIVLLKTLNLLATENVIAAWQTDAKDRVYGLEPERIRVFDLGPEGNWPLRCEVCAGRHAVPPGDPDRWNGAPCLRYRCEGHYREDDGRAGRYYRDLYRQGVPVRVIADEHTGGLQREMRERLEQRFKRSGPGAEPGDPNVLSCTPTLEMGVDIGALDSIMLTSVPRSPASYLQRVGRAGRKSGNSFVSTFVQARPRGLYFLERPRELIDGEVVPPDCWLDAIEILRRQYFAFLMDRAAAGAIKVPDLPRTMEQALKTLEKPAGYLHELIAEQDQRPEEWADEFLNQFGNHVADETRDRLRQFARHELRPRIERAVAGWQARLDELRKRRKRLDDRIKKFTDQSHLTEEEEALSREAQGERRSVARSIQQTASEYPLTGFERIGLLPNYNLADEGVRFTGTAWSRSREPGSDDDSYEFVAEEYEAHRGSALAIRELAPGASFYTAGKRFRIDQIELAGGAEQAIRTVRICTRCDYVGEGDPVSCPRCGSPALGGAQARYEAVSLDAVSSLERADDARVEDNSDDRERVQFSIVTTVDVDVPGGAVKIAWKLPEPGHSTAAESVHETVNPFGVELAEATINWINLGRLDRPGHEAEIAGEIRQVPGFDTCVYCGVVQGAKPPPRNSDAGQHRGWCPVRSGARNEKTENLILRHSLDTEVVRIILPLADLEVEERLASFKAALMLGLRLDLGGSPDHLRVLTSSSPGGEESGSRRRFLVIRDTVPGGTGYLERLTDFRQLGEILRQARDLITHCECREEGRKACYRCLMSEAGYGEEEIVDRKLALEMINRLLESWQLDAAGEVSDLSVSVPTIGDLSLGPVEESELERRVRLSLIKWAEQSPGVTISEKANGTSYPDLELSIPAGGPQVYDGLDTNEQNTRHRYRYRIREQEPLDSQPYTRPDFVITGLGGLSVKVAIYSDGFRYHADPRVRDRLADDAAKRAGARTDGVRVWSMTWDDVTGFFEAIGDDPPRSPDESPVLSKDNGLLTAGAVQRKRSENRGLKDELEVDLVNANPLVQLFSFLSDPEGDDRWTRLAKSAVTGLASGLEPMPAEDALRFEAWGRAGLPIELTLDTSGEAGANAERWRVRTELDDSEEGTQEEAHKGRWQEWLWWSNLLQFLDQDGCSADFEVKSLAGQDGAGTDDVGGPAVGAHPGQPDEFSSDLEWVDDECRPLLQEVLAAGASPPEIGYELPDGETLEAAWPKAQVAVTVDGQPTPEGWDARPVSDWTVTTLLAAVRDSGS